MDLSYILNELGEERDLYFNAIAPPLMQTSNFRVKTVAELAELFADESSGYLYSRGTNPTVDILRKKLAALDAAEDALVFNSGAAAIFAAVLAQVKAGDHIISVARPYTWAQRLFERILPRFGVQTTYVDGREVAHFAAALQDHTRLIYLESPNSWTYELQDLAGVAALARARGIVTICDNSYCTPLYQKPLALGIDIALQSATKYISGHSDVIAGVITGSKAMMSKIFASEYLNIGSGIQPFNAWLLLRGLRTLPLRLQHIAASTRQVVAFLQQHPAVEQVIFPGDPSFPQAALAQQQMTGTAGLLSFRVKAPTKAAVVRFAEGLEHIMMGVSWGGHESLIIPGCASVPAADFDPTNPAHTIVRLYVGLEDPQYLMADLHQALEQMVAED